MPRTPIIGGNFKCNGSVESLTKLVRDFDLEWRFSGLHGVQVVLCPSALHLQHIKSLVSAPGVSVAAQNCVVKEGAFTGEISAGQIKNLGLEWVVLGHSERRTIYGESDEVVGAKVKVALAKGLNVIACLGETLQEREAGETLNVCYRQLAHIAANVSDWSKVVLAYEPVWAIGTGKVATPQQAQDVHAALRQWLLSNFNASIAHSVRIQYGGSVNAKSAASLWAMPDIDGFLVGGASLKPEFKTVVSAAMKSKRTPVIGGNFKCNGSVESLTKLVTDFDTAWRSGLGGVQVVLCPSAVHLQHIKSLVSAPGVSVAAQNCVVKEGAFTGEISAGQIKDLGLEWVVLGHSERRTLYGESDEVVGAKVKVALAKGLNVIACLGETLQEREAGNTLNVCYRQLAAIAANVSDWGKVVLAYEPVWAIGTGKVASPEQAQEVHAALRDFVAGMAGASTAAGVRIQYGGSVNAKNSASLWAKPDIDGFLVGGASLKPEFKTVVSATMKPKL